MLITFVTKISIWLGVITLGLVSTSSTAIEPAAAVDVVKAQPFSWKYLEPKWSSPSITMLSQFEADFSAPQSDYGAGHRGIDFKSSIGAYITSPVSGILSQVARVSYRDVITVQENDGPRASFEPVCTHLKQYSRVSRGQVIGRVCTPAPEYVWHCELCVHFSARQSGQYLNPLLLTGHYKASVLKPYQD